MAKVRIFKNVRDKASKTKALVIATWKMILLWKKISANTIKV
jgi:hypothetical protein